MNRINYLGYLGVFIVALYLTLKLQRLPGPHGIMLIGGLVLALYIPISLLRSRGFKDGEKHRPVHLFGSILLGFLIMSVVLRFQYWALVMFKNKQLITFLTIEPWLFDWVYLGISFIFIPWLIWDFYKLNGSQELVKNVIGGIGLSLLSLALVFNQHRINFWKELLSIGNVLFILGYVPLQIRDLKNEGKDVDSFIRTLIVCYLFIVFIYFIFWREPVTYQDVIKSRD